MKIVIRILIALLILGLIGVAGYFFWKYQKVSGAEAAREISSITNKISKFMVLPDEPPTLATVADKTKLEGQKFFKNAENGDKVLIFPMASKAILYRPSKNLIVEVAAVQSVGNDNQNLAQPTVTSPKVYTVAVLNGSGVAGLAAKVEKPVSEIEGFEVISKDTANDANYSQTIVINNNNVPDEVMADIATNLNAKTASLPAGEKSPKADIIVIVGKDKQ